MKFREIHTNSEFKGTSLRNLLWIMRQYANLDPFSKVIVRDFVVNGKLPDDWSEIITRSHDSHLDSDSDNLNK